ncbi:MAG: inosine 5'-monophosphate dehydrogenase [Methanocella sp. PtaU1.Bin125]|nr:MAG: inosine 5'-monophosphate dehydrogenase [Methanocella sp. PtaU1.Bin125]
MDTFSDVIAGWKGQMPVWVDELKRMGVSDVAFFSQLDGRRVYDVRGLYLGRLHDLIVKPGERFLDVSALTYRHGPLRTFIVPWGQVADLAEAVRLDVSREQIPPGEKRPGEMSLREVVLDKQIVDTEGLKVVRVNDVLMARISGTISVIGVDTGVKGLFRRMGLAKWLRPLLRGLPDHFIPWAYIQPLQPELMSLHLKVPRHGISDLHPADIADIIEELNNRERLTILKALDDEKAAEALEESDMDTQVKVARCMSKERMAHIMDNMATEEAADLLAELSPERASELLSLMDPAYARQIAGLLKYPETSAGGLMSPDYVAVTDRSTVGEAVEEIRQRREDVWAVYYVYIVDLAGRLRGFVSLKDLILTPRSVPVTEIMTGEAGEVTTETPAEEIASFMAKYDLLSVPVVDKDDKLKGVVTIDDIIDLVLPARWKQQLPKTFPKKTGP